MGVDRLRPSRFREPDAPHPIFDRRRKDWLDLLVYHWPLILRRVIKLAQAAMLGHMEAMRGLMIYHYCKDEYAEALYWAKRGAKETRMIGRMANHSSPASMIPILEKLIAEQRS